MAFSGFGSGVFEWFAGLESDNSKAYFTATRELFDAEVRGGLEALLEELEGEFGAGVKIFRQHRDLRFSRDKSPYKTRTYGVVGGRFYAELSAPGLYAGTGRHQLDRAELERFRSAVDDTDSGGELAETVATARAAGLDVVGEALKTAPRGYPADHPRVALLRHKALIAGRRLAGAGGVSRAEAVDHVAGTWRAAAPLNAWLDTHVTPGDRVG